MVLGIVTTAAIANKTGKTIGVPGSFAHILTNKKLDSKPGTIKDIMLESTKDTAVLAGTTGAVAGAAGLAAFKSPKVAKFAGKVINKAGDLLSKVSIGGKNLKDVVANSSIYTKFNSLPTPAKAAVAAGAVALAIGGTIWGLVSQSKAGYIEGQHEVK